MVIIPTDKKNSCWVLGTGCKDQNPEPRTQNPATINSETMHQYFDYLLKLKFRIMDRRNFIKATSLVAVAYEMILSSFGLPKNATMSDWLKSADELNEIGVKTKKAGIQTGFHNHHTEFEKIDETLIYDALMEQFDPGIH